MKMQHSRDKSCTDATAELNFEYLVRDRQIYKDDCDNSTLAPHLMNEFEEKSSSSSSNSCCSGDYLNMVADEYSLAESNKIVYNSVITESDALSKSNKQVDETIINDGILSSEFLSFVGEFKTFRQLEKLTSGQSIDVNLNYAIDPCLSRSSNEDYSSHIDNAKRHENEHVTGELSSPFSFDEENSSIPTVSSYQTGLIITDSFDTIPVTNTSNPRQAGQGNFEESDVRSFDVTKMLDMATEQFKRAQYNSALGIYEHLLKIHISENGYHQESVASTLHQIATCHIRSGRYTVAQPFIEEAVRLKMTLNGNNHQEVAHSLQKLGMILISNKNFGGALQILHRSLRIYRSEISNKCPETLDVIFKIGCVHFQINEYMAALMAFEEALEIDIFLRDSNNDYSKSIEKIDILSHIGFVKIKLKQYGDAIIFFQEALELQRVKIGNFHTDTLRILDSIAFAYMKTLDFQRSLQSYSAMLHIQHNAFGPKCGSKTLTKMSLVFERMHKYSEALLCRKQVLELQEKKFGPDQEVTMKTKAAIEKLTQHLRENQNIVNWI